MLIISHGHEYVMCAAAVIEQTHELFISVNI